MPINTVKNKIPDNYTHSNYAKAKIEIPNKSNIAISYESLLQNISRVKNSAEEKEDLLIKLNSQMLVGETKTLCHDNDNKQFKLDDIASIYNKHIDNNKILLCNASKKALNEMQVILHEFACEQQLKNPEHYVSHGFDHSMRTAEYTHKILQECPEIVDATSSLFSIKKEVVPLLHFIVAHWHDVGYINLKGRTKATHGLCSASIFDAKIKEPLKRFFTENTLNKKMERESFPFLFLAMKKSIQLHSGDVDNDIFSIKVKTNKEGGILVSSIEHLERLLNHYNKEQISDIKKVSVRGSFDKLWEITKKHPELTSKIKVNQGKKPYKGRVASLDSENNVVVGLKYKKVDLLDTPFALIRLSDNMDIAKNRLSKIQNNPCFKEIYRILGGYSPVYNALADLKRNAQGMTNDFILQKLNEECNATPYTLALNNVYELSKKNANNNTSDYIYNCLIQAVMKDVICSQLGESLTNDDKNTIYRTGKMLNEDSILHFDGSACIVDVNIDSPLTNSNDNLMENPFRILIKSGNLLPDYFRRKEVENFQINRMKDALKSIFIGGNAIPVVRIGN